MPTIAGLGIEIELPRLPLRVGGLFTAVVPQVDIMAEGADRTGFGAKWIIRDAYDVMLDTIPECSADDSFQAEEIDLTTAETLPFSAADMISCTTIGGLSMPELNAMLDDDVEATRSFAFAAATTTQISVDHLNLADDSTDVGPGADVVAAMGLIEDGLGDRIANLRGYIFVPLTLLAEAVRDGSVQRDEMTGELTSPAGHLVIADAGHGPQDTLFGTGAMAWGLSPAIPVTDSGGWVDRSRNKMAAVRQRYGVVAFNPNHSVRATVT